MLKDNTIPCLDPFSTLQASEFEQDTFDRSVLAYMAQVVQHTYQAMGSLQHVVLSLPAISYTDDPTVHVHRVIIYNRPPASQANLHFVGFLSKQRPDVAKVIADQVNAMDTRLVTEIAEQKDLLNYSSLQLHDRIWCNLVVFAHPNVKEGVPARETHRYAAYELAPHYYQWIRLHHGQFAGGDLSSTPILHLTKYYTFHQPTQQPSVHIRQYVSQKYQTGATDERSDNQ